MTMTNLSVKELRIMCKENGVKNYFKMSKQEIIEALEVAISSQATLEIEVEEVVVELASNPFEAPQVEEVKEIEIHLELGSPFLPKHKEVKAKSVKVKTEKIQKAKAPKLDIITNGYTDHRKRPVFKEVIVGNHTHVNNTTIEIPKKWFDKISLMDKTEDGYILVSAPGYIIGENGQNEIVVSKRNDLWKMVKTIVAC